jgi:Mg-chelatase subunit ChlD
LGNESRFGVIQNEMLTEQAQAVPTVNSFAQTPPPAAMPPPASPVFAPPPPVTPLPVFEFTDAVRASDKPQVNLGDNVADKSSGSRGAERPAEPTARPSRPAPTAPADRKNVQDDTVRLEQELAERRLDGRRGLGEIADAESKEALIKKPESQPIDPATGLPLELKSKQAMLEAEAAGQLNRPAAAGEVPGILTKSGNQGLLRDLNRNDAVEERSGLAAPAKSADSFAKLDAIQPASEPAKLATVRLQETDGDETRLARAKTPVPEPQPEIETRNNAFSTFSLNVSDVSFKLAAAALEKGVRPDPGSIRTEEFINAFDYRDPEPAPGVPVAFAQERARYPFAHNRDLLRFSIKTAASGRAPGRPLNLVLLLDNSGSMERADRVQIIRACLRVLAGQLRPEDRISVVAFARTARLWVDGLPGSQANELGPRVGGLVPEGGTNLEDALRLAYQTARRHYLANGVNRVVLLTDGAANLGDVNPTSLQQQVEVQRRQGYALDCFGIGWEGYNDDLLETLARHGDGRYGFVNTPEAAATDFAAQLAGALQVAAADVKVQIEFNPQRVTLYRQIGYAKHQLTKQQFRDNTVDAAELGAAEAGNALYVVQVNPQGEGPLATVRVRFKNPATGLFSEREWMVPYTGPAAPLEQASPALRLAATASAFSEWLAGSPFAAEVTTDRLSSLLRGVSEAYGSDPRPRKLEWMLRQAR